jgi:ribonucleoside-diphosphate reductase alpha chain
MDCDTTGIEPDLSLVKTKKLVGGGTMSIVNQTVPRALDKLGYSADEREAIVAFIAENNTIMGAPGLKEEHKPVFACSMGDNVIQHMGHIRMMGAAQPFLSGAISKTVNLPETATVEDIEDAYMESWKLGLKAVAVYRDNCKLGQPLSSTKKEPAAETAPEQPAAAAPVAAAASIDAELASLEKSYDSNVVVVREPIRERMPKRRRSSTFKFRVADCEGYVTVGEYDDGRPGEIFVRVAKQGSTLAGIMDAFAVSVSLGLQYGVPLATYVNQYCNTRFEPAGMTDDPDLRIASSLIDYIFRRLAVDYLDRPQREQLGILTSSERVQPTLPGVEESATPEHGLVAEEPGAASASPVAATPEPRTSDAPYCSQCGIQMVRAGSCHACPSCGTTSGCS